MSNPDDIDEVFRDIRRLGGRDPPPPEIGDVAFPGVPQLEDDECVGSPRDELILGDDYVTYLVFTEKEGVEDFLVSAGVDSVEVKTADFKLKRELGLLVSPEDPLTTYANGVFSVRLRRVGERDAVG